MHWCYTEHKVEALMSIEIDTVDVSGNRSGHWQQYWQR